MRDTLRRAPLLALIPVLLALGLGLAACGDDDEGDSGGSSGGGAYGSGAAQTTETETETETTTTESGGAAAPKAAKVEIVDFTFSPATTTVQLGGKVNWANEDTAPHTATAKDGSFDTGTIESGKRGNATFKEAGTFAYICDIHPEMKGTVEVVE